MLISCHLFVVLSDDFSTIFLSSKIHDVDYCYKQEYL